jgi:ATP-dependent Lon protease
MTSETIAHETIAQDIGLDDLLNQHFPGKVVRKDLTKLVKECANVPVYVLEYLLGNYCASNDEVVIEEGLRTVKKVLAENYVRPDEAEKVKSTIRERGSLKIIDKVTVTLNEKRDVYEALLSNLGVKGIEVPSAIVKKFEKLLVGGIWCLVTLTYFLRKTRKDRPFCCRGADHGCKPVLQHGPATGRADRPVGRGGIR